MISATPGEKAAVDDALDAAAATWTALRVLRNQARACPEPLEQFPVRMASEHEWSPLVIHGLVEDGNTSSTLSAVTSSLYLPWTVSP
jgi:hypothetical protein